MLDRYAKARLLAIPLLIMLLIKIHSLRYNIIV